MHPKYTAFIKIFFSLFNANFIIGQCANTTTITLNTQTEVNNLLTTTLNGCTTYAGSLRLNDASTIGDKIIDLQPLSTLTALGRDLIIQNCDSLVSFLGMQNMTNVGRNFLISGNDLITEINYFDAMTNVGGNLSITLNDKLVSLNHFNNLISINGSLDISSNDSLIQIEGFSNLTKIAGNVNVDYHKQLKKINAFQSIDSIGGATDISNNPKLDSLFGFDNLDTLFGNLTISLNDALKAQLAFGQVSIAEKSIIISGNDSLNNLFGFSNLKTANLLSIFSNMALTKLDGLEALKKVITNVTIRNNDALVNLNGLNALDTVGGTFLLRSNFELLQIEALSHLKFVGATLDIDNNDKLVNVNGLQNLKVVVNDLIIENNALLSNVDSLTNVDSIYSSLYITNNPQLSECCGLFFLVFVPKVGNTISIFNNNTGCNTVDEIIDGNDCFSLCSFRSLTTNTSQTVTCLNSIAPIKYKLRGGTPEVTGLPNGISTIFLNDTLMIFGSASHYGNYLYTVTPTAPCDYLLPKTGTLNILKSAAAIGTTCYSTLTAALEVVEPGQTIDIFGHVTTMSPLEIPSAITIQINTGGNWTGQ